MILSKLLRKLSKLGIANKIFIKKMFPNVFEFLKPINNIPPQSQYSTNIRLKNFSNRKSFLVQSHQIIHRLHPLQDLSDIS